MRKLLEDRWVTLALALFAFGIAVWPLIAGLPVTVEDGFYYFKIAQNIVQGAGSTFDGEHPTNGYHPLWLLCLLPVFAITATPVQALALGKVVQALLAAITAGLLYRSVRTLTAPTGAAIAVLLWIQLTHLLWLQGLELALHGFALAGTLYVYLRWFRAGLPRTAAPFVALGLGCAVTLLARLDAALLTAVLGAALLAAGRRTGFGRPELRRLAVFVAPPAIAVLAYAAANLHLFGHALPVSGAVKRAWSQALLQQQPFYLEHGWLLEKVWTALRPLVIGWNNPSLRPLALGLTTIGVWLALTWVAGRRRTVRGWLGPLRSLLPWAYFGLASYLAYVVIYHRGLTLTPRYYVIQPILAALVLGVAFDRLAARLAAARRASAGLTGGVIVVVVLLALTLGGTSARINAEREGLGQPLHNAAGWTARHLPADARIGSWNAGTLAYLSGRRVVNLDGLVNSWEFFERERHDLCGYWRETGITHLVDVFRNGERVEDVLPIAPVPIEVGCPENLELLWMDDRYDPAWSIRAYRVRPIRTRAQALEQG